VVPDLKMVLAIPTVPTKNDTTTWNTHRESLKVKDSRTKKVVRVWKPKRQRRRLVIRMDVGLEETCQLSLCALVGRFSYKTRCTTSFLGVDELSTGFIFVAMFQSI
jgi:hypothetical protein